MTYKYIKNDIEGGNYTTCIKRISDSATIPFDEGNTDYQIYKRWLEEGNTPQDAD
tara:strand:+ start:1049 stop:1213 length:165 start_codon:yes stop_codon:yes gene_type:complete